MTATVKYFTLDDDRIIRVENILSNGELQVRVLDRIGELFDSPVKSSILGISMCKLGREILNITREQIICKLYRVDYTDNIEDIEEEDNERQSLNFEVEFAVIPLLHT